jgi:sulfite exporter TauE/SafE
MELTLSAAFLVGLLGGVHCVGMCGGIVGALSSGLAPGIRLSRWRFLSALLAYNVGRILSYGLAGLLLGLLGQQVVALKIFGSFPVGRVVGGVFMVLFGFYLAGWWRALLALEQAGAHLWKHIEPLGRRFIPVHGSGQAFLLGLVWGWLPCGMVYAVLALALAGGSVLHGGLVMLVFGLGTLPLMVGMGFAMGTLTRVLQGRMLRTLAGGAVMSFGLYTLFLAPPMHDHHEHTHGAVESTTHDHSGPPQHGVGEAVAP